RVFHVTGVQPCALPISPIPPYPSIFLGSAEVVPAELVAAYAAFANGGYRVEPRLFHRVEDSEGRVLWQAPPPRQRVLDDGTAYRSEERRVGKGGTCGSA